METLTGTTIFWLIGLGSATGWVTGYIIGHEGIPLISNVVWGMFGAPILGVVGFYLDLGGVLVFAFIGTLAVLFLANVFHVHHVEDVTGDIDRGMRIVHKKKK